MMRRMDMDLLLNTKFIIIAKNFFIRETCRRVSIFLKFQKECRKINRFQ